MLWTVNSNQPHSHVMCRYWTVTGEARFVAQTDYLLLWLPFINEMLRTHHGVTIWTVQNISIRPVSQLFSAWVYMLKFAQLHFFSRRLTLSWIKQRWARVLKDHPLALSNDTQVVPASDTLHIKRTVRWPADGECGELPPPTTLPWMSFNPVLAGRGWRKLNLWSQCFWNV